MEKHIGFYLTLEERVQLVKIAHRSYLIKTGSNTFRGVDYKYDSKAVLNAIATDILKERKAG